MKNNRWTYANVGIDIKKIKGSQKDTAEFFKQTFINREGKVGKVLGEIGHYAGLIEIGNDSVLALHTDGVGTKVIVAEMMNKFDTIGIDCIAMNVNDVICLGAEPISFLDYIALKKMDEDLIKEISKGLVFGAKESSISIVGGETAIMPDVINGQGDKAFDLVGMVLGIVNKKRIITGDKIKIGDEIIGVESSGIHSNGLSLARNVLLQKYRIDDNINLDRDLGEELLRPTKIYVKPVLDILNKIDISGLAHITGGGFSKLTRLSKDKVGFKLNNMPKPLPIFDLIQKEGRIDDFEMYRTFNMGIGFCLITSSSNVNYVNKVFRRYNIKSTNIGKIVKEQGVFIDQLRVN